MIKVRFEDWRALVGLDEKPLRPSVMCWRPSQMRLSNN